MTADYSKFKTPYFKISIGDSSGKNMIELPKHIAMLVESVEITETMCCNAFNQITINMVEGSREPYKSSSGYFADPEVYNTSNNLLSNQTGMLTDLRVESAGDLSASIPGLNAFVERTEIVVETNVDTLGKDNTPPPPVIEEHKIPVAEDLNVRYLFHQRNQVAVTWGYKEDVYSERTARAYILMVTTDFPESGSPKTKVVCHSGAALADQVTTNNGKLFGKKVESSTDESGNTLYDWQDDPPNKLIESLAQLASVDYIVSPEFRAEIMEEGKAKHWMGGQSLHQFLMQLAVRHHAVYDILINPSTGKDTLVFLNRDDFEKFPILSDTSLLSYKTTGSIVKSISIRADFGMPVGTFVEGISEEGGKVGASAPGPTTVLFEGQKAQNNYANTSNPVNIAVGAGKIASGGTPASSTVGVETSSLSNLKDGARAIANKMGSAIVSLEFNTLGLTKLTTGSAHFSGIGERYNGSYKIHTVTHSLGSSGYSCKGTALSYTNGTGGVTIDDPTIKTAAAPVTSKLFEPAEELKKYREKVLNIKNTKER